MIRNTFITCRQLETGSRVVALVGVLKSPNWQINYGSGKDVGDETIKDAGDPMQIKWFNTSTITLPVLR